MEPPYRFYTHRTPQAGFNPRTLESHYKSPVTRRREYCDLRNCIAKVGTDLKYEFNSRPYCVDRAVNKTRELKRNVRDIDKPECCGGTNKFQQEMESSPEVKIDNLQDARRAITTCLQEMERIKAFLEDESSWWKIFKGRSFDCCQQKLPHLHGVLDGSSVTLMLFEEGTNEAPRRFVTLAPKEKDNIVDPRLGASPRELTNQAKQTKQCMNQFQCMERANEQVDPYSMPHYNLDVKSALIEVTSHEPTQQYVKRIITSEQSIASEFWAETRENESNEQTPKMSPCISKETCDGIQYEDEERRIVAHTSPREIQRGGQEPQTSKDTLKHREEFSNKNTESKQQFTSDFESNVDLNTKIPSRNVSYHKPKTKTIIEKGVRYIQKISKTKSKD